MHVFRAIPYAQPPVGPLRFRSPQAVIPWDDVRQADVAGPASYQITLANSARVQELAKALGKEVPGIANWPAYVGKTYNQQVIGEDCLYLDLWVPASTRQATSKGLPVYVYFHGGANAVSSGSFTLERGDALAA